MSLIHFHRFLIATGIVFCLGFAVWVFAGYLDHGGIGRLALALTFFACGVLLSVYLARLRQFLNLPDRGAARGGAGR